MGKPKIRSSPLACLTTLILLVTTTYPSGLFILAEHKTNSEHLNIVKFCTFASNSNTQALSVSINRITSYSITPAALTKIYSLSYAETLLGVLALEGTDWYIIETSTKKYRFHQATNPIEIKFFSQGGDTPAGMCSMKDSTHFLAVTFDSPNSRIKIWDWTAATSGPALKDNTSYGFSLRGVQHLQVLNSYGLIREDTKIERLAYNTGGGFWSLIYGPSVDFGVLIHQIAPVGTGNLLLVRMSNQVQIFDWVTGQKLDIFPFQTRNIVNFGNSDDQFFLIRTFAGDESIMSQSISSTTSTQKVTAFGTGTIGEGLCIADDKSLMLAGGNNQEEILLDFQQCNLSCLTCFGLGPHQCLTCLAPTALESGFCVALCSNGKYKSKTQICVNCPSQCQNCSETGCIECLGGFNLHEQSCIAVCPDGYVSEKKVCLKVPGLKIEIQNFWQMRTLSRFQISFRYFKNTADSNTANIAIESTELSLGDGLSFELVSTKNENEEIKYPLFLTFLENLKNFSTLAKLEAEENVPLGSYTLTIKVTNIKKNGSIAYLVSNNPISLKYDSTPSASTQFAQNSGKAAGDFSSTYAPISEVVAYIVSIFAANLAFPALRALNTLKFTERLGYININYGKSMEEFFLQLSGISSDKELIDYTKNDKTLEMGKMTARLPKYSFYGIIKTAMFLFVFFLRIPFQMIKRLFLKNDKFQGALKILCIVNYYKNVIEYAMFNSYMLDGAFQVSASLSLYYSHTRSIKLGYLVTAWIGTLISLYYTYELFVECQKYAGSDRFQKNISFNLKNPSKILPKKAKNSQLNKNAEGRKWEIDKAATNLQFDKNISLMYLAISDISEQQYLTKLGFGLAQKSKIQNDPILADKRLETISGNLKAKRRSLIFYSPFIFMARIQFYLIFIPACQAFESNFLYIVFTMELANFIFHVYLLASMFYSVRKSTIMAKMTQNFTIMIFTALNIYCTWTGSNGSIREFSVYLIILSLFMEYLFTSLLIILEIGGVVYRQLKGIKYANKEDHYYLYKNNTEQQKDKARGSQISSTETKETEQDLIFDSPNTLRKSRTIRKKNSKSKFQIQDKGTKIKISKKKKGQVQLQPDFKLKLSQYHSNRRRRVKELVSNNQDVSLFTGIPGLLAVAVEKSGGDSKNQEGRRRRQRNLVKQSKEYHGTLKLEQSDPKLRFQAPKFYSKMSLLWNDKLT